MRTQTDKIMNRLRKIAETYDGYRSFSVRGFFRVFYHMAALTQEYEMVALQVYTAAGTETAAVPFLSPLGSVFRERHVRLGDVHTTAGRTTKKRGAK